MSYRDRLQPWCIVRYLPNLRRAEVERFRSRAEAEQYLQTLQRLLPKVQHCLLFDPAELVDPAELDDQPNDRIEAAREPIYDRRSESINADRPL